MHIYMYTCMCVYIYIHILFVFTRTLYPQGGENIRKMVEESGAQIKLSGRERQVPGIPERPLTVGGKLDQVCNHVCIHANTTHFVCTCM